jgi:predicted site-specific integrase-resolvase
MNLRLAAACALCGVSSDTMRAWGHRGIVRTVRYGRETRYVRESVEYVAKHGTALIEARLKEEKRGQRTAARQSGRLLRALVKQQAGG